MSSEASSEMPPLMLAEQETDTGTISVSLRRGGEVRICAYGLCVTKPAAHWVRLDSEGIEESKHIDAMLDAIRWYFAPHDAQKVRQRYLELMNKDASHIIPR